MMESSLEVFTKFVVPSVTAAAAVYRVLLHQHVKHWILTKRRRNESIDGIPGIATQIVSIESILQEVRAEMRTNGGSSLRDEVRRLSAALAVNEQRIRTMLQSHTSDAIFETDRNGNWIWANRALVSLTGRSHDELEQHGWKNIIDPSERVEIATEWITAVQDQRECSLRFHMRGRLPSDPMRPATITALPVRSVDGSSVIGFFGIVES